MDEIFKDECDTYYKIFSQKDDPAYKYRFISPFEFKNILIKLAVNRVGKIEKILNVGRGNPIWFSTVPRYAFALLTQICVSIGDNESHFNDIGLIPEERGISKKFKHHLNQYKHTEEGKFLTKAVRKIKNITGFSNDKLIHSIVISTIGCLYPDPPRVQDFVEPVLVEFLDKIIYKPQKDFKGKLSVFPTEGATAAIVYIFNSLKYNNLVNEGDKIGILTPIFSPYLEIPGLKNYNLDIVCIKANEENQWDISDEELEKIGNPEMKALFLVNPTNPTAVSLSIKATRKIKTITKSLNPNLIIIADNVYAPFVNQFNSLLDTMPYNTIGVYSFSKYFGVTGWRLGLICMHDNNVIDKKLLKNLSEKNNSRYSIVNTQPKKIKFIDRLLIDSRLVAEAHTAGLSTPQQTIMALFAVFDMMNKKRQYNDILKLMLKRKINKLIKPLEYKIKESGPLDSNYYIILNIIDLSDNLKGGTDFGNYLLEHRDPIEFVFRLAKTYATVVLSGLGFAGPFWSVRISLANLREDKYYLVGENIRSLIEEYYQEFKLDLSR